MALYTKVETPGGSIWVEVDQGAQFFDPSEGYVELTSIGEKATQTFQEALDTLKANAQRIITQLRTDLVDTPNEIEVEFGLKVGGEAGGNAFFALAKTSIDASYNVKLTWKLEQEEDE